MKMIGRVGHPPCGSRCCGEPKKKPFKRMQKRRERQTWKKEVK